MAGTQAGGKAAGKSNMEKYGADYYARIGALGGSAGRTGGFYANRKLASMAGRLGGAMSRRGAPPISRHEALSKLTRGQVEGHENH